MDARCFDKLTRGLGSMTTRRGTLAAVLSGALSLLGWGSALDAAAHDLLPTCKKIKDKAKRKKCLKKAKAHHTTHLSESPPPPPPPPGVTCTPNCAGKNCGLDGCGGVCGPCDDGTCTAGICVCRDGEEVCQGTCVAACGTLQVRRPGTCTCCGRPFSPCQAGSSVCCSQLCPSGPSGGVCGGRGVGEACQFNAECLYENCTGGVCGCPIGTEPCPGGCASPCPPDQVRVPGSCSCCITDGSSCASATRPCCSGICLQSTNICRRVSDP